MCQSTIIARWSHRETVNLSFGKRPSLIENKYTPQVASQAWSCNAGERRSSAGTVALLMRFSWHSSAAACLLCPLLWRVAGEHAGFMTNQPCNSLTALPNLSWACVDSSFSAASSSLEFNDSRLTEMIKYWLANLHTALWSYHYVLKEHVSFWGSVDFISSFPARFDVFYQAVNTSTELANLKDVRWIFPN